MNNEILKTAVKALDDKKATDIQVIKTEELTIVADYFIIATANSNTHIRSLADEVEFKLEEKGIKPDHIEGRATGWVVMQYEGIVIHLFLKDAREYYNLERLWSDGQKTDIDEFLK